ncbi:hypothetical protein VNO80_30532 [Phaseolus coccineus]|uniref:Uncharacterized protein n=1 Tax=Phaseolus coccineus TaxID=3886 RepID=A0AAN9QDJ3_PHACN
MMPSLSTTMDDLRAPGFVFVQGSFKSSLCCRKNANEGARMRTLLGARDGVGCENARNEVVGSNLIGCRENQPS